MNAQFASLAGHGSQPAVLPSEIDPLSVRRPLGVVGEAVERAHLAGFPAGNGDRINIIVERNFEEEPYLVVRASILPVFRVKREAA